MMIFFLLVNIFFLSLFSSPTLDQVLSRKVHVVKQGDIWTIVQDEDLAVISWHSFNLQPEEKVIIYQKDPSFVLVNYIEFPMHLSGKVYANGQLYFFCEQGASIDKEGLVDCGGILFSTLGEKEGLFLSEYASEIKNEGYIFAEGQIFLISPHIKNTSAIYSKTSGVYLLSGQSLKFSAEKEYELNGYGFIENEGLIKGKKVFLQAESFHPNQAAIRQKGLIESEDFPSFSTPIQLHSTGLLEITGEIVSTDSKLKN